MAWYGTVSMLVSSLQSDAIHVQGSDTSHHEESKRKFPPLLDSTLTEKNSGDIPTVQGSGIPRVNGTVDGHLVQRGRIWGVVRAEGAHGGCDAQDFLA
ncbi:hypothetical protein CXB51_024602 [Gossypium anomalum]|uniref:Uncharacterized protein n=1 Tax=Gossypium anomalum TaxID=47600 RepID=A0A8J5YA35_9ROSI|nr:hypothetical protein CXB51_024602 [Gossypium anomalum]